MKQRTPSLALRRHGRLAAALLGAVVAIAAASIGGHRFVWNLSPSLPRGLYLPDRSTVPSRGAIVTLPPPANAAAVIAARRYLPAVLGPDQTTDIARIARARGDGARRRLVGRLQTQETLQLATRTSPRSWRLAANWQQPRERSEASFFREGVNHFVQS